MKKVSTISRIISVAAIIVIFVGTQGFVTYSHTCNSCGTHEESISLFWSQATSDHECRAEEAVSCCPAPPASPETDDSCCNVQTTECDEEYGDVCCEYEFKKISVETLSFEKTINTELRVQPLVIQDFRQEVKITGSPSANILTHNKHGSGRDITRLKCSLQI